MMSPSEASPGALDAALAGFARVVGAEHVHRADDLTAEFADPYGFSGGNAFVPSAVVQPGSVDEVRGVLAVANEHKVPVWTSSQGRNNGYGGGAPRESGTVVLNLRRMNRILEVNEELGYALIEPGVSYFDLYEHIRSNGYRLWVDVPDLGWGSVIGNALDHGYGYTPYGDHGSMACGMEVVLADGDVVRTGMGGLPGSRTWQVHKRGFGPSLDSMFMQSNFGVITKLGFWLMPQPEVWRACWVHLNEEDQIDALIDTLRPLMVDGTINHRVSVRKSLGVDGRRSPTRASAEVLGVVDEHVGTGAWNARIGFYGSDVIVDESLAILQAAVSQIPGAHVVTRKYRGDAGYDDVQPADRILAGIPSLEMLDVLKWYGTDTVGHVDFTAIARLEGEHAFAIAELVKRRVSEAGGVVDVATAFGLQQRAMYLIALILFDYSKEEEVHAAHQIVKGLIEESADLGYGAYRTHLSFMDHVADQYGVNDHAQRRLVERIKDALDPNGILSPGKQGIWPRSRRGSA